MSLRRRVTEAIDRGDPAEIEELVALEPRSVRHFLASTYQADKQLRATAARAIAMAARHHPKLVQDLVRRLIWAMNDESGTNALTAPEVVQAIALERPEILIPLAADLMRLSSDSGLREGLLGALSTLVGSCPGQAGEAIEMELGERLRQGQGQGHGGADERG